MQKRVTGQGHSRSRVSDRNFHHNDTETQWNCICCSCVDSIQQKMLKSVSPRLSPRGGAEPRIIRLTTDQEAVLQEQFNRCPRAPHTADIVLLAAETGLSEADVQGWYAIRLAQWRKEQGLGGNLHFSN
ncbi:uncharacterized protein LOC107227107 isoform X2 [Neodiprion lecontei]|uniref:Homeodomain-only protein n=1 Tax=Neodiprion lecontei TaxID=441921 RepID=A0ABM3FQX6_NEOLC|nr:uncharacterized protein LOC107227107 isoform X2 [Neodiprion lecontei]